MHGGLPWRDGRPPKIKDLSVNLNPLGVPRFVEELLEEALRLKVYTYYPDDYRPLRSVIAEVYDLSPEMVGLFNGASEAISLLQGDYWVPEPNYSEYPRGSIYLAQEERDRFRYPLYGRAVVTSHPNNPTGAPLDEETVVGFLQDGGRLVLDQSFADISPVTSFVRYLTEFPRLLILTSFTKSFSIPGLRIGFTLGSDSLKLERRAPPWRVNGLAYYVFSNADPKEIRSFLNSSREKVRDLLDQVNLSEVKVYRSSAPFLLVETPMNSTSLNSRLKGLGYHVRECWDFVGLRSTHVRVALDQEVNKVLRLIRTLSSEAQGLTV
ncbi:MAG: aminotransferase class I/II-fold pyridoxal phosphate-dependent enzyme [Metallosphaera yellowstonensis]|jgi:Histidinol-phosphate/aromatic aminotransferase and cobyric acid decarboxylase